MEHPCHRCGTAVEDGSLFCKNCGAPQIRVAPATVAGDVTQETRLRPDYYSYPGGASPTGPGIEWSRALGLAAVCGLLEAVFTLFGLGLVAGGALCVALYGRRRSGVPISLGQGVKLGAVAGAAGWLIFVLMTSLFLLTPAKIRVRQLFLDSIQRAAAQNPSPQAQEFLRYAQSPEGFIVTVLLTFAIGLVFFLALSSFGGMVGSMFFNKRSR